MYWKNKSTQYYLRNFLAWAMFVGYGYLILFQQFKDPNGRQLIGILSFYSFIFAWVVFHNLVLLEKLLFKKKYTWYFLSMLPCLFIWDFVSKQLMRVMGYPYKSSLEYFSFLLNTFFGMALYLGFKYLKEKNDFYQTLSLKREFEMQQLKSQLNPHFLFNALNNIYSYTLHSNKFGNELILKLSDLMRFILESSEKEKISLASEISFIENYIAFETERLGQRCSISYSKNILFNNREIAPLILFPFVENAFKYGANIIQKTTIEILIYDTVDSLRLVVKNSIINKNLASTKKGLSNAIRRLGLIYPGKHVLKIEHFENLYIAELTLHYEKNQSDDSG